MMQLPWDEHYFEIVVPAWQAYLSAERILSEAVGSKDNNQIAKAKYAALREGGAASFYVHHFGEIVLRARPHWLPDEIGKPKEIIDWLGQRCTMLRTDNKVDDVALLRDIADALKHAVLSRNLEDRQVAANEAVLVVKSRFGQLGWGEGKWGGVDQVLVLAKNRTRPLSSILQNVIDAWRRAAGIALPPIGEP